MGAVFAFIFWILFLVLKKCTGYDYNRNLALFHFIYFIYWLLMLLFFPMHFFRFSGYCLVVFQIYPDTFAYF